MSATTPVPQIHNASLVQQWATRPGDFQREANKISAGTSPTDGVREIQEYRRLKDPTALSDQERALQQIETPATRAESRAHTNLEGQQTGTRINTTA